MTSHYLIVRIVHFQPLNLTLTFLILGSTGSTDSPSQSSVEFSTSLNLTDQPNSASNYLYKYGALCSWATQKCVIQKHTKQKSQTSTYSLWPGFSGQTSKLLRFTRILCLLISYKLFSMDHTSSWISSRTNQKIVKQRNHIDNAYTYSVQNTLLQIIIVFWHFTFSRVKHHLYRRLLKNYKYETKTQKNCALF